MARSRSLLHSPNPSRRQVLVGAGSALFVGGIGSSTAGAQEVTPAAIIPAVEEFENNYVGQFLTIRGETTGSGSVEDVQAACEDLPWPENESEMLEAQLTDRRSNEPIAIRLPAFINGQTRPQEEDALFIISDATPCGNEYVQLQLSAIDLRSITTGESGPGADDGGDSGTTDNVGAGLGLLAGAVGGVGAVLARLRSDRDSSTD